MTEKTNKKNNPCGAPPLATAFLAGSYCPACAGLDEGRLLENWHPAYFLIYSFIRRCMGRDYAAFGGDCLLAMVVGEIWLYNMGRYLRRNGADGISRKLADPDTRLSDLPACNAYSISESLGIPRETVRRKVKKLIDMGWVDRRESGDLTVTAVCEQEFQANFVAETVRDFVSTARHALDLVERQFGISG